MMRNPLRCLPAFLLLSSFISNRIVQAFPKDDVMDAVIQENLEVESSSLSIQTNVQEQPPQRRQLFWSLVFLADLLKNPPCPPIGPPHDRCVAKRNQGNSNMNNGSSNSSLSSSTSYSSASGSSSSTTAKSSTNQNVGAGAVAAHVRGLQWLMFLAALVAVAMAVFAVVVGQRQQEKKAHLLQGSVLRRMNLFSNFCNSALSDSTARPSRAVEMTMPGDDYDEIDKYNDRKHSTVV